MSDATRAKELLQQLTNERHRGLTIKRAITLGVLGMFVLAGAHGYYRVKTFDTEQFVTELERQASTKMWPLVSHEIDTIATQAVPAISAALATEAANLLPRISQVLEVESALFSEHLQKTMQTSLDSHFLLAAGRHNEQLKERFPQFATDQGKYDALITRLNGAAQTWAHEELDTTFKAHIGVLQSINEQVQSLMAQSEAQRASGGNVDADEVMLLFLEIMNSRMAGEG